MSYYKCPSKINFDKSGVHFVYLLMTTMSEIGIKLYTRDIIENVFASFPFLRRDFFKTNKYSREKLLCTPLTRAFGLPTEI